MVVLNLNGLSLDENSIVEILTSEYNNHVIAQPLRELETLPQEIKKFSTCNKFKLLNYIIDKNTNNSGLVDILSRDEEILDLYSYGYSSGAVVFNDLIIEPDTLARIIRNNSSFNYRYIYRCIYTARTVMEALEILLRDHDFYISSTTAVFALFGILEYSASDIDKDDARRFGGVMYSYIGMLIEQGSYSFEVRYKITEIINDIGYVPIWLDGLIEAIVIKTKLENDITREHILAWDEMSSGLPLTIKTMNKMMLTGELNI